MFKSTPISFLHKRTWGKLDEVSELSGLRITESYFCLTLWLQCKQWNILSNYCQQCLDEWPIAWLGKREALSSARSGRGPQKDQGNWRTSSTSRAAAVCSFTPVAIETGLQFISVSQGPGPRATCMRNTRTHTHSHGLSQTRGRCCRASDGSQTDGNGKMRDWMDVWIDGEKEGKGDE